jgi:tetratricopeptide (TPR) repeat protein
MASLYYQWNENMAGEHNITNHIRRAKEIFEDLIIAKPGQEDNFYFLAMLEAKYYNNYDKAREYFIKIIEINPTKWAEITNLIGWMRKEEMKAIG